MKMNENFQKLKNTFENITKSNRKELERKK